MATGPLIILSSEVRPLSPPLETGQVCDLPTTYRSWYTGGFEKSKAQSVKVIQLLPCSRGYSLLEPRDTMWKVQRPWDYQAVGTSRPHGEDTCRCSDQHQQLRAKLKASTSCQTWKWRCLHRSPASAIKSPLPIKGVRQGIPTMPFWNSWLTESMGIIKCCWWTSRQTSPGNSSEMQDLRFNPRPTESKSTFWQDPYVICI